jgi:UTP:GlnB (protein PII) uridylyltransferase
VRTVSDCVQVANLDMQSKTSLIEARLVAGDARLFEKIREGAACGNAWKGTRTKYIAARREDQGAPAREVR